MFVKICGITRLEDAEAAVALGAGAIGFVFWPNSPRFIEPSAARAIVARLSPLVAPVGVFVNQPSEDVNGIAAEVGLGLVQLHGDETIAYAQQIDRPVMKALAVRSDMTLRDADMWPASVTLLLDAANPVRRGGTGQTVDWSQAAAWAARRRTVLAGGLTPDNIADAIARVRPFGVDVSSGVEVSPGIKNHDRLRDLFARIGEVADLEATS
jgi:phosphoribosylanthranilate isomerase